MGEPERTATVTMVAADKPCSECTATEKMLRGLAGRVPGLRLRLLRRGDDEARRYGVFLTPLVLVDDEIFSMGRRPPLRKLEELLKERCGRA